MNQLKCLWLHRAVGMVAIAALILAGACALALGAPSTALAKGASGQVAAAGIVAKGKTFVHAGNLYKVIDVDSEGDDLPEVKLVKYGSTNKKPVINTVKHNGVKYEVEAVGKNAFNNVKGHAITHVTLGKNVDSIGSKAFYGCTKLKVIDMRKADVIEIDKNKKGYYVDEVDVGSQAFKKAGTASLKVKCGVSNASYKKLYKQALVKKGLRKGATVVK